MPADQALKTAHLAALKKALDNKDTEEMLKSQLKSIINKLQKELDGLKKPTASASDKR